MLLLRKIQNAKRKGIIFEKLYGAENNFGQELQRFFDEKRSSKQYAVHKKMHALAGADLGGGGVWRMPPFSGIRPPADPVYYFKISIFGDGP